MTFACREIQMTTAILSTKGQITIPAPIRLALGIEAGDRVEFIETEPGQYALIAATLPVTALKGLVSKPRKPVSLEAMNEAIADQGSQAR